MVQGVGFRYTTQNYAAQLTLAGWVKNLPDRRVEIVVVGPQEKIEELCQKLGQHFGSYIHGKEIKYSSTTDHFEGFQIKD